MNCGWWFAFQRVTTNKTKRSDEIEQKTKKCLEDQISVSGCVNGIVSDGVDDCVGDGEGLSPPKSIV